MQLNLGPLNEFVEYLTPNIKAEYPEEFYGTTYIYDPQGDQMLIIAATPDGSVTVPTFDIEVKLPLENNHVNRNRLANHLSLVVLQKILLLISKHPELQECLHNNRIAIPVRNGVCFGKNDDQLCVRVELGILFGIDPKVKE